MKKLIFYFIFLILVFSCQNNREIDTISGTFEGGNRSAMFIGNDLFIYLEGTPLVAVTFTVSGSKITLHEDGNDVATWTRIDVNTIKDHNGGTLQRVSTVSGRFYGQRVSNEFRGNVFISYLNDTALFNGTFTVSGSEINITGADIDGYESSFILLIVDSNTVSDGDNFYRKR